MRVHTDARQGRPVASGEVGRWRAHGLVGLGYKIGAVTHLRYAAPPYILINSTYFLRLGLCSVESYFASDVDESQGLAPIAKRRSRGPKSMRSSSEHVRK